MAHRLTRGLILVALVSAVSGCGPDERARPSAGPSLLTAQVSGQWNGTRTLDNVTGFAGSDGECVSADVAQRIRTEVLPADRITLSMTQSSSEVTGRLTSIDTGLSCTLRGKAALTTMTLDTATCDAPVIAVSCSAGVSRGLRLVGTSMNGTFRAGRLDGTITSIYNVFVGEDTLITNVILNYRYTATRQ
jgi:hypothetical protein